MSLGNYYNSVVRIDIPFKNSFLCIPPVDGLYIFQIKKMHIFQISQMYYCPVVYMCHIIFMYIYN